MNGMNCAANTGKSSGFTKWVRRCSNTLNFNLSFSKAAAFDGRDKVNLIFDI